MKKLLENKKFVLAALATFAIAIAYAFSITDEPRMSDGALEFSEASIIEIIIIMLAPISGITMWALTVVHSFSSGRKIWGVVTLFAWPLAFLYALLLNFIWEPNRNA